MRKFGVDLSLSHQSTDWGTERVAHSSPWIDMWYPHLSHSKFWATLWCSSGHQAEISVYILFAQIIFYSCPKFSKMSTISFNSALNIFLYQENLFFGYYEVQQTCLTRQNIELTALTLELNLTFLWQNACTISVMQLKVFKGSLIAYRKHRKTDYLGRINY